VGQRSSQDSHLFVGIAKDAIVLYLQARRVAFPREIWYEQFDILRRQAGVFVTLRRTGELRGCIGTIEPAYADTAVEIIENAISAAFRDPRFSPVCEEELSGLSISVDIVKLMEPVRGLADLNPSRYGVVVRQGRLQGLLLPGIEDISSVEEQVAIAREKGGIDGNGPVELYRFQVDRYH
jgi:AmmeMemoRadiSam system protein A